MFCSTCGVRADAGQRYCRSCGAPLGADDTRLAGDAGPGDDQTRLAGSPAPTPRRTSVDAPTTTSSDGGRFPAGHLLAARYRIVRRLGRGGMGEVYLADDLTLGQPVALKFLPEAIERDPDRLAQLQNEVRLARQVSHPNVCRVYDIGDADGVHFLSMEYIDGEDLASLLRRIGRLPEERATDLARQLALGVAAAHARGVLHRDLKPANVMIDGDGRLRITDFGLAVPGAAAAAGLAGTPAYMAPEQLAGQPATDRSDLFAAGLVLYELYTGRRVFTARTIDDLRDQHTAAIPAPSAVVAGLQPAVDRLVLTCLDPDPAHRPASALAIAAALPGGDPLAAALAAGETPSPELVAASGGRTATLGPAVAVAICGAIVLGLVAAAWLADRFALHAVAPMTIAWDALEDRARSFESSIAADRSVSDRASGMQTSFDAVRWLATAPPPIERDRALAGGRLPTTVFWHRSSPRLLIPVDDRRGHPSPNDPPFNDTGMTTVVLDTRGRLLEYAAVPPQVLPDVVDSSAVVDWRRFFEAAGLDAATFEEAPPRWTPRVFADDRRAWTGGVDDLPGVTLRVEAASYRGSPVSFQVSGPWSRPARMQPPPVNRATEIVAGVAGAVVMPACLVGGVLLARANLRRGRGDRRGALRLAMVVLSIGLGGWVVGATHFPSLEAEQGRFGAALARATLAAGLYALLYLAIEPAVRRMRPLMLVTWSRLVSGRFRDPMLGRDLLAGAAAGVVLTLVQWSHYLVPGWFGWPPFLPSVMDFRILAGTGELVAALLRDIETALAMALVGGIGIVLLSRVFRDLRVVLVVATVAFAFLGARGQVETGRVWLDLIVGVGLVLPVLTVLVRYGFVAGAVAFFVHFATLNAPASFDSSLLAFGPGLAVSVLVVILAATGAWLATEERIQ